MDKPLLEKGCPVCGKQVKLAKEIAWQGWLVALLVALGGYLVVGGLALVIALVVPLAFNRQVVKCQGCSFKQVL
jgi:hypothetical protein